MGGPDTTSPLTHGRKATTAPIYDLDDPEMIAKFCRQPQPTLLTQIQTVTCRFLAIPLPLPGHEMLLTRYGTVILETGNKLIMRMPTKNGHLLNRVRNAWVSKYLARAPFTECTLSFDMSRQGGGGDRSFRVIIQKTTTTTTSRLARTGGDDVAETSKTGGATAVAAGTSSSPTMPVGNFSPTTAAERAGHSTAQRDARHPDREKPPESKRVCKSLTKYIMERCWGLKSG
ncbi:hypothetical protein F5Y17DRAFT_328734 [Xylariaceae sp. FL0594]|nr:hypothetical protein F5Y17DRAFT_328734 [Xylariaceae sp. FL0594]